MAKTLLLADDSVTIRRVVELTFADTDVRVVSVPDGRTALERFAELQPDLVLADVVMPEPSGYELCRRVKASERPVPVLLLAGAFEPFDPVRADASGADGHLIKPFESSALVERVRTLLDHPPPAVVGEDREVDQAVAAVDASEEEAPRATRTAAPAAPFDAATLDALARAVAERLSVEVLREVAHEVVPRVAVRLVRERIREIESEGER